MKKLTYSLALLFAATTLDVSASYNRSPWNVCVPKYCGGIFFGVTGLYWEPSNPHFEDILLFPITEFPIPQTIFHERDRDRDFDWGYQINAGYVIPCSGNDIQITYTYFNQNDHFHLRSGDLSSLGLLTDATSDVDGVDLVEIISTGTINDIDPALPFSVFLSTPLPTTLDSAELISAKSDNQYYSIDLDFGQHINVGCNFKMRWFGGLRYANFENTLDETFVLRGSAATDPVLTDFTVTIDETTGTVQVNATGVGTSTITDDVRVKNDFQGIGPRFGVESEYNLGRGFGIVGGISTALIVGDCNSSIHERFLLETTTSVSITETVSPNIASLITDFVYLGGSPRTVREPFDLDIRHPDRTWIVPNVDANLGIDFEYNFCNADHSKLILEAGYKVSHFWNTSDFTPNFILFLQESREVTDISFDGPYFKVQVQI